METLAIFLYLAIFFTLNEKEKTDHLIPSFHVIYIISGELVLSSSLNLYGLRLLCTAQRLRSFSINSPFDAGLYGFYV